MTHFAVGKYFVCGWDGSMFYCQSQDRYGLNMMNIENDQDTKNVSENSISRTFHEIYVDGKDGPHSALGGWSRRLDFYSLVITYEATHLTLNPICREEWAEWDDAFKAKMAKFKKETAEHGYA